MNDDASTFDLPEYIHSRLQPQILIDFPERDEELQHPQGESAVRRRAHPAVRDRFSADWPTPPTSATRCATASTSRVSPSKLDGDGRVVTSARRFAIAIEQMLGEEAMRYTRALVIRR